MKSAIAQPELPWVHAGDVGRRVASEVAAMLRRVDVQTLTVTLAWPSEADGCWCYSRSPRPHPHVHDLGGCPVHPAGDNYLRLSISRAATSQAGPT